ncbi:MAG: hypothetical protein KGZ25_06785 [Planctomycetes bacterium]|nr:hypothetical protein [Planctomycetota bacterium]
MKQENLPPDAEEELRTLKSQILSLAGIVESVFTEATVALVDNDIAAAREAKVEDYKAHQEWLRVDTLACDLLSTGKLELDDVQFVCAAIKMALNLRMMADQAVAISKRMQACPAGEIPPGPCTEILPRMVELSQSIYSDSIEAFVNRDGAEAQSQHLVFRELSSLNDDLVERVKEEMVEEQNLPAEVGTALILVGRSLEFIGEHTLDIANYVSHLYPTEDHSEELEGETE